MRIEVLIGNEDPVVYPLNASKITIGTSESCDIILSADGVSRKHITILTEGDNYYVLDQGSTNGSFINEERLIPGRKTEFTSFFPVRLGDNVLISLISDEEGAERIEVPASFKERTDSKIQQPKASDRTSVISVAELNKVKTEKLVQNRDQKRVTAKSKGSQKKAPPKKKVNLIPYIAILIVIAGGFYNYQIQKEKEAFEKAAELDRQKREKEALEVQKVIEAPAPTFLIPENELVPKTAILDFINSLKCTIDVESYLCQWFPYAQSEPFGAVQSKLNFFILVDAEKILKEAETYVGTIPPESSPEDKAAHELLFSNTAAYIYLLEAGLKFFPDKPVETTPLTPQTETTTSETTTVTDTTASPTETPAPVIEEFDVEKFKDNYFFIALMKKKEDQSLEVVQVIAIKPEALTKIKTLMTRTALAYVRADRMATFIPVKDLYRIY